ncbi:MAG: tetratricopeptide repeat protein [Saprospiraceae bacterium]
MHTYGYVLLSRKEPKVYDSLADAYEQKGDIESALNMYEKVLEIEPKHEHATERIEALKKD